MERRHQRLRLLGDPEGFAEQGLAEQVHQLFSVGTQAAAQVLSEEHLRTARSTRPAIKALEQGLQVDCRNAPANAKKLLQQNMAFWDEHGDDLDQRFTAWAAQ